MNEPIFHVDSFTDQPFAGNPAAVCLLSGPQTDAWLQNVARDMNLAETAFLTPAPTHWELRWFTPTVEVDLCGHATLASAHILWETGRARPDATLVFQTRSGRLSAERHNGSIELDFPAERATSLPPEAEMLAALGVSSPGFFGRNRLDYLIEVENERTVRSIAPDFRRLKAACGGGRGVIVTAASDSPEWDFISRFFAPSAGIDEDPVTGSAHCCLGPYWGAKLGKTSLSAFQASARGGEVRVRLAGERVFLGGHAVTIASGQLKSTDVA
jgi:PhzF family phenazine biosynthesis protein